MTYLLLELLKSNKINQDYITLLYNIVAVLLWVMLGADEKYVAITLGAIVAAKAFFKIDLPLKIDKLFLPLTIISLAPITQSIVYGMIFLAIIKREQIRSERINLIGFALTYILMLYWQEYMTAVSFMAFAIATIAIIRNFRLDNSLSLLLWILIQTKLIGSIAGEKYFIMIELIIILSLGVVTFLIWLEKRMGHAWHEFNRVQPLFIWFSAIQLGSFGLWLSLCFFVLVRNILSRDQVTEEQSVLKIKPTLLPVFYLLPVSLPMFFFMNTKDYKTITFSLIVTFLYFLVTARWLREIRVSVKEILLNKWHTLDIAAVMFLTAYLSYKLIETSLSGVIAYTILCITTLVLFATLKIDNYILDKVSMPRVLMRLKATQNTKKADCPRLSIQNNLMDNVFSFNHFILAKTFVYVERNFLVFFMIVFVLVFFIGGGFV